MEVDYMCTCKGKGKGKSKGKDSSSSKGKAKAKAHKRNPTNKTKSVACAERKDISRESVGPEQTKTEQ